MWNRTLWLLALPNAFPTHALAAEEPATPIHVRYAAPDVCPTERDFVARIKHRLSVQVVPAARDAVVRIEVQLDERAGGVHGEVKIDQGGAVEVRKITGDTCDEAVTALALITTVVLETPKPSSAELPRNQRPSEKPPTIQPQPSSEHEVVDATPASPPPSGPAVASSTRQRDYAWQLGAGVELRTAAAPETLVGFQAQARMVALEPPVHAMLLTFSRCAGGAVATPAGTARFELMAGELRGCPWMWSEGPIQAGPCATVELGRLRGIGEKTEQATTQEGMWLAPGLLADWRLTLGPVALAAAGGVGFPLIRDLFYFELKTDEMTERVEAHQAPLVDWRAEVTLGFSSPQ